MSIEREGMIVSLYKKGDQEDPNFRGITLLNVVGKLFDKAFNYRLLYWLVEHNKLSESFRFRANAAKCAVVVFRNKKTFDCEWFW